MTDNIYVYEQEYFKIAKFQDKWSAQKRRTDIVRKWIVLL